ncbi:2'-5' RNA ligase family protein [Aliikangiella sp. G2MR2-5]|uniref:2'-5' RNA ligase family protein n=1 Tax=Aliikangiella sp. G2MR2-5 TaxID=2788943 RepID=UPI0018AC3B7B
MQSSRKQLSMYASGDYIGKIETVRKLVDPIQFRLIPAHITLCREDELKDLNHINKRLSQINFPTLKIRFAKAKRFGSHGLMMECIEGERDFLQIREFILESTQIRRQIPHVTLAHPRNNKASSNSLTNTFILPENLELEFPTIHLIEQINSEPWHVLSTYDLQ